MAGEQPQRYIPPQRRGSAQHVTSSFDSLHSRHNRQTKCAEYKGSSDREISLADRKERIRLRNQQQQDGRLQARRESRPEGQGIGLGIHLSPLNRPEQPSAIESSDRSDDFPLRRRPIAQIPRQDHSVAQALTLQSRPAVGPRRHLPKPDYTFVEVDKHGMQVLPRYYTLSKALDSEATVLGSSLYQSIASLVDGDSSRHNLIKIAVMQRYLWLFNHESHPLHDACREHTFAFYRETCQQLFTALECPDWMDWNVDLLWVIATMLNISLRVYSKITEEGEVGGLLLNVGSTEAACYSLFHVPAKRPFLSRYAALVSDKTGRDLVGYMHWMHYRSRKEEDPAFGLQMERVSWASIRKDGRTKITCYNGFRDDSREEHLATDPENPGQLHTFQVEVSDPRQLPEVIKIIKHALERAPYQGKHVRVSTSCKPGRLLPHTSTDMEFVKLPRDKVAESTPQQIEKLLDRGELEYFPSSLTITVDGVLSVQLLLLHMMEHATEHTVPNLQLLGEEIIFNSQLNLLWWNPQMDTLVMDTFYAHLFQGTPRNSYYHVPRRSYESYVVKPTFKLTGPFFQGERPKHLNFIREVYDCELHQEGVLNEQGLACPCATGNHDISALLSEACRQQGRNVTQQPWIKARPNVKLSRLIERVLQSDPRLAIFEDMKGCVPKGEEEEFYRSLGQAGMRFENDHVKYATGDALVPGIVLDLLTAKDTELRRQVLTGWAHAPDNTDTGNVGQVYKSKLQLVDVVRSIPLFDQQGSLEPSSAPLHGQVNSFVTSEAFLRPEALTQWEHDEQVDILRQIQRQGKPNDRPFQKDFYEPLSVDDITKIEKQKHELCVRQTDIRKMYFPATCAVPFQDDPLRMIVRSNMTHSEALVQCLDEMEATQKCVPPGFGARPGKKFGLPDEINRVPGQDIPLARNIFDALGGDYDKKLHDLPPRVEFDLPSLAVEDQKITPFRLVAEAMQAVPADRSPKTFRKGRDRAIAIHQAKVDEETRMNEEFGLPSFVDVSDVLDPEGREYRRRMENAPEHMRQLLMHVPYTNEDGSWKSVSTMRLAVVKAIPANMVDKVDDAEWQS